ncbi:dihydrodipicolinate reductase [Batrachochytrium salamandrivorans]|nr:dihydrodipicolinate reductase [Batrachochytrium salamandrivorans]
MAPRAAKKTKVAEEEFKPIAIVNGLPGAMGVEIAQACLRRKLELAPFALTGPNMPATVEVEGTTVKLINATTDSAEFESQVEQLRASGYTPIAIDFTHPSSVNSNADLYNKANLPFVMGTTGGDRDKLKSSVGDSKNVAVIAPNMCKQIVAFQAMFEYMQDTFPGSFQGYDVSVTESHQSTKADTSGTAKAVCQSLAKLVNKPVEEESITKLRTDEDSKRFGVEEQYLLGHAHHTYRLTSADKTVVFEFKHNVNGRSTYAEGVVDAVLFLASKLQEKPSRKKRVHVFDMVDVLKQGEMK